MQAISQKLKLKHFLHFEQKSIMHLNICMYNNGVKKLSKQPVEICVFIANQL